MRAYKDPLLEEFDKEEADGGSAASKTKASSKLDDSDDDEDSDGSDDGSDGSDESGEGMEDIKFPRDNAEDLMRFI